MFLRLVFLLACFGASVSHAETSGLISIGSKHSFRETVSRLEKVLKERHFKVFAKVDHKANAQSAGISSDENTVFIFGNPNVGTPIMQQSATAGIDLPVRMQIYQKGKSVSVVYNDPAYLAERHGVSKDLPQIQKMSGALKGIAARITE